MNISIREVPEGEERREKGAESLFKAIVIAENFTNLGREMDIHGQEAQKTPRKINQKKIVPRHIIIKMLKVKYKENF